MAASVAPLIGTLPACHDARPGNEFVQVFECRPGCKWTRSSPPLLLSLSVAGTFKDDQCGDA